VERITAVALEFQPGTHLGGIGRQAPDHPLRARGRV